MHSPWENCKVVTDSVPVVKLSNYCVNRAVGPDTNMDNYLVETPLFATKSIMRKPHQHLCQLVFHYLDSIRAHPVMGCCGGQWVRTWLYNEQY